MQDNMHRLSVLVLNRPGVLTRISGLFARRGYNIDSLTVCATENDDYSRMTVTVRGNDKIIKQIQAQLQKQVDVVQICTIFKAKPIDVSSDDTMIIELTGETSKIDALIDVLKPYGVLEMARSGGSALGRGGKTLRTNEND